MGKILNVEKARFDKMLSSVEVGTLITALGCGIGKDEFDVEKLRYHRIIIMTDADVDGSHIRTLLLTFFYRQMPILIERGYIYIGQPPLYKIKQGKQEHYIKDEGELNEYLLARALDDADLRFAKDALPMSGEALEGMMRDYLSVQNVIARLGRRYDPLFLRELIDFKPINKDVGVKEFTAWCADLQRRLNESAPPSVRYELSAGDDELPALELSRYIHGVCETQKLGREFFGKSDFRAINRLAKTLHGLFEGSAIIRRGKHENTVESFAEACDWLMEESRKGRSIQRFKGLGEMNPDQLWDTTINPETRRLLQVTIEDAVAADVVFATLMGDEVEPRREFIEANALDVANLDV